MDAVERENHALNNHIAPMVPGSVPLHVSFRNGCVSHDKEYSLRYNPMISKVGDVEIRLVTSGGLHQE